MIAFILPFIVVIGALVVTGRDRTPSQPPAVAGLMIGAAPPPQPKSQMPSPLAVLNDYVRGNIAPPPFVIQCAIAEAELLGRFDVAHMITKTFLIPALERGGGSAMQQAPQAPNVIDAQAKEASRESTPASIAERVIEQTPAPSSPAPVALASVSTPSPIPRLPDEAWQAFAGLMIREAADFDGPRHVGRYRHSKDRLAAIGFDPEIVLESVDVQDDAFAADAADAFRHLGKSGTLDQVVGRGVEIPDVAGPVEITSSGVLALAMVGGLEGAIGWLERSDDRKRYPHTTAAFLRGNGVF